MPSIPSAQNLPWKRHLAKARSLAGRAWRIFIPSVNWQQAEHILSLSAESVLPETVGNPYIPPLLEPTHDDLPPGSVQLDVMDFDLNSWSSVVVESFANTFILHLNHHAGLEGLMRQMDQVEETSNSATNPVLTFSAPGTSAFSQLSSPDAPSLNSQTDLIISSEHQSYQCSWHLHDSGAQCNHVAPDRQAFLQHLSEMHQVSGTSAGTIICRLLDSKMGSVCTRPLKRGNFPRHVDTHYPLRYHCPYCPPGTSFSRQDSWMKHMKNKHPETLLAS